ncbi:MAG: aldehyde dehydrogenase family protein [Halobacteriovoraceae bacterium]|nr:aldehyde dehydrogenase family protein [Halobacteriovoraceae bacterium]MCB9095491.1 aldehyde dehydrogenase family protein [Halobacteriovoraceae bacterium]
MKLKGNYYNGNFHISNQGDEHFKKHCPADLNQILWEFQEDCSQIDSIIDSAIAGFKTWKQTPLKNRMECIKRYALAIEKRKEEIARALSLEVGKPLWESLTEASGVIAKVNVTLEESLKRIENTHYQNIMPQINGQVNFKPIGPSIVIGPFNFPCHLPNGQILSLLLAGNSIIFKPSEKTVYSAQLLIECFHEAQFPAGVINFFCGGAAGTQRFTRHPDIKGIFFTGSKPVGLKILESTYRDLNKLVALELGGKNSSIVHSDASQVHAVSELIKASFLTSGQRCTSSGNILVHRSLFDSFSKLFKETIDRIIVDHPITHKVIPFMGPLIDEDAVKKFQSYIQRLEKSGAEQFIAPREIKTSFEGHYCSPVVHTLQNYDAKKHEIIGEERFAPHTTLIAYDDIDEALSIANSSEFGLAAAIFTQDEKIFQHAANTLDVGIFNRNRSTVGASSKLPFGGVKNSGNYRPAAVSMIDACVYPQATLETADASSHIHDLPGLRE